MDGFVLGITGRSVFEFKGLGRSWPGPGQPEFRKIPNLRVNPTGRGLQHTSEKLPRAVIVTRTESRLPHWQHFCYEVQGFKSEGLENLILGFKLEDSFFFPPFLSRWGPVPRETPI